MGIRVKPSLNLTDGLDCRAMSDAKLTAKQSQFVVAFVDNELTGGGLSGTEIALSAGYSAKNAASYASDLLATAKIQTAIADRKTWLAEQAAGPGLDAMQVLRQWVQIATADPTRIVGVRRVNCRHCWGVGFGYQWQEREYAHEAAQALQDGDAPPAIGGGFGFQKLRAPHPDCPECAGEGVEDMTIADFRKLPEAERRLIAGVKMGKHGIEVQMRNQDDALKNLARYLGVYVEKQELTGKGGGPIQTQNVNYNLPTDPQEAARAYQQIMGMG